MDANAAISVPASLVWNAMKDAGSGSRVLVKVVDARRRTA
jgi:hypothetical protein